MRGEPAADEPTAASREATAPHGDHDHGDHTVGGGARVSTRWLDALAGSTGAPLPAGLRKRLEVALEADLGGVRVHGGSVSDAAAQAIDARAFTLGQDIHFAGGTYDPGSAKGQTLIAHEVAHAVQGGHVRNFAGAAISTPGDAREQEAERFAAEFVRTGDTGRERREPHPLRSASAGTRAPASSARPAGLAPWAVLGRITGAVVHRDGGDGPAAKLPAAKPPKPPPRAAKSLDVDQGQLAQKHKEANDPERDKKAKAEYEKAHPNAPKDPAPVKAKVAEPPKVAPPKPIAKPGGHAPPAAKKGAPAKPVAAKLPAKTAVVARAPVPTPPPKGAAESAVCAAADADAGKFWASAKHDPKALDISKRSREIWAAAQGLAPGGDADDMVAALNPVTAVYNDGFGKSDLGQAIAGLDQSKSPYAEFNARYRTAAMTLAGIRDVSYNLSNVLGKVGLALTVVGFILSLFGVGAVLITIGRVLSIINMILDAVAAIAGIALACVTAAQIKEETDPYKRAKLAKLLIGDVNKAASNVVNLALASTSVGKAVGKTVGRVLGKIVSKIAQGVKAAVSATIGRVYKAFSRAMEQWAKQGGAKAAIGRAMGTVERTAIGLGKKAMSNRASVLAEVDVNAAAKAERKTAAQAEKAAERATAKADAKGMADTTAKEASAAKKAAADDLAVKRAEATTKTSELNTAKTDAVAAKGELEGATKGERNAKTTAKTAERDARAAEKAQKRSEADAKVNDEAAEAAAAQRKAADDAAKQAADQKLAAEKAKAAAETAVQQAKDAEQQASAAATKAEAAATRAQGLAGGDARAAEQAAAEARAAAADAKAAADKVAAAQRDATLAQQASARAAQTEKQLADARTRAAEQAEQAAKAQQAAARKAAEAQQAAKDADAAAQKAAADKQTAEKIKRDADLAASERAKADAAKKTADDLAVRKAEADAAARKAKLDAETAATAKLEAERSARERVDAEAKAGEAKRAAESKQAEAAVAQRQAEETAAKSKVEAERAAKAKADADAKVQQDRAAVAQREAELRKAEAERAAKASKEAADKAAAEAAAQNEAKAVAAKDAADAKLERDTQTAAQKRREAETKQTQYDDAQKATGEARKAKELADANQKLAQDASTKADAAAKQARTAADHADAAQDKATHTQAAADERVTKAEAAKKVADDEAAKKAAEARQAEQDLADAQTHKNETKITDPDHTGPVPKVGGKIEDGLARGGIEANVGSYAVGQWQQELATKNDPRDQWGWPTQWRLDLDPAKMTPRAPRMTELKASSPRAINVSDSVAKIFAKKQDDPSGPTSGVPAQGPTGAPPTHPSPGGAPAPSSSAPPSPAVVAGEVGPIPYWPELAQTYSFDLSAMGEARSQVHAYKAAQQSALQTAQGSLKKRAAEIRAEAAAKKAPVAQNQAGLDKDKTNLDASKAGNQQQIDNDNKNDAERNGADGPAHEGGDAAEQAAAAEPPPAKSWWDKIKAAANWFLKNTLGRAMKFVTDAITNVVLWGIKQSMGLDVKEIANYGMQTADEGKAKAGEGSADTQQAGTKNDKVEADIAVEDMTLGQRIAAAQHNLHDADEFEKTIADQEKALQAEIAACQAFVKQIEDQFARCKAEADAKKNHPPEPAQPEPAAPHHDATPTPAGHAPDEHAMDALVKEAAAICTGAIDTEIAQLKALDAKGASILSEQAAGDPALIAEAGRLSKGVEAGALAAAVARLEGLRAKATSGSQAAVVDAAHQIDAACHDEADKIVAGYQYAETELLSAVHKQQQSQPAPNASVAPSTPSRPAGSPP